MKPFTFWPCLLHQMDLYHPPISHLTPPALPGFSFFQLIPTTDPLHQQFSLARALSVLWKILLAPFDVQISASMPCPWRAFTDLPQPKTPQSLLFPPSSIIFIHAASPALNCVFISVGSFHYMVRIHKGQNWFTLFTICEHPTCIYGYSEWVDRWISKWKNEVTQGYWNFRSWCAGNTQKNESKVICLVSAPTLAKVPPPLL